MSQPGMARGNATRTANMKRRRERILASARAIITTRGLDAFSLKEVARRANITVPTIYNLIGNKSQIFEQLVEEMIARVEHVQFYEDAGDPFATAEAFIDKLVGLFSADEDFYKAAYVAGERAKLLEHELSTGIFARSLQIAVQVCIDGAERGFLRGRVGSAQLGYQLFGCHRLARQDWVNGYIDLQTYKTQALTGIAISLAADATPAFHARLMEKIDSPASPSTR